VENLGGFTVKLCRVEKEASTKKSAKRLSRETAEYEKLKAARKQGLKFQDSAVEPTTVGEEVYNKHGITHIAS
jgi:hypothetical protein